MTFFLAFALQCIFPLFDSVDAPGVATVNNEATLRNYSATVLTSDGVPVVTGRYSLAPGMQFAYLLREMAGPVPLPREGSLALDSESSTCSSYLTSNGDGKLSAADSGPPTPSTAVLLPHIEVNTGFMELNHTDTVVAVVNPGPALATVAAQLFTLDGILRGSISLAVPPRGTRISVVSHDFAAVLPDNGLGGKTFQGYLRLNASAGIMAWQRIDTPLSQSLLRGKGASEIRTTTQAMIPHFAFGGDYGSFLNLLNPTAAPVNLRLSAHDDRGNLIGEVIDVTLKPGEQRRSSVGEFFRVAVIAIFPPPLITGYIRIREAQGNAFQIAGDIEIFTSMGGGKASAMLYPISDFSSTRWLLPFVSSAGGYFSGYTIVNPNVLLTVQTDVTIDIVSRSGTPIATSSVSLSPAQRHAATIPEGHTGYIRINANLPIQVLGAIGGKDGTTLEQVPATTNDN